MFSFLKRLMGRDKTRRPTGQLTIAEAARKYAEINKGRIYYLIRKQDEEFLPCLIQNRDILYLDENKFKEYIHAEPN